MEVCGDFIASCEATHGLLVLEHQETLALSLLVCWFVDVETKPTHLPKASKAEEPVSYPFPLGTAEEACDSAMMVAGSWLEKLKRDGGRLNRCVAPPTSKQQALCECSNFVDILAKWYFPNTVLEGNDAKKQGYHGRVVVSCKV